VRAELEAALGNAAGGIQDVNTRLDDAESAVEDVTTRVDDAESSLGTLNDTTEAHTAQFDEACDWARSQENNFLGTDLFYVFSDFFTAVCL
jgi:hypothetical protein